MTKQRVDEIGSNLCKTLVWSCTICVCDFWSMVCVCLLVTHFVSAIWFGSICRRRQCVWTSGQNHNDEGTVSANKECHANSGHICAFRSLFTLCIGVERQPCRPTRAKANEKRRRTGTLLPADSPQQR